MASKHLDLNDLRLLMLVVQHGGYTAAAGAIGMPKSTLSQRLIALESAAGTALLRRTSRSLSLTEAGRLLLPHARSANELAKDAEQALAGLGGEVAGVVRLSCSISLAHYALAPILPGFLRANAGVSVRVEVTNRYVDLIGEGFDLGVRAHSSMLKDSTLLQRTVGRVPWSLAASPSYLEHARHPSEPADLADCDTLHFGNANGDPVWRMTRDGRTVCQDLMPRLCSTSISTLQTAALEGGGVTGLPTYIMRPNLASGRLVPVLSGWALPEGILTILTPPRTQSSRPARALADYIAQELPRMV